MGAGIQNNAGKSGPAQGLLFSPLNGVLDFFFVSVNVHIPVAADSRSLLFPTPFPVILQLLPQNQNVLGVIIQSSQAK